MHGPVAEAGPARHFARISDDPLRDAFGQRRALLPWGDKMPVPADEMLPLWEALMAAPQPPRKRLAYVHVPFCVNHCLFCGFYRNAYVPKVASRYVALLTQEIEREAHRAGVAGRPVHAVYFGGGTPSALSAEDLSGLIRALRTSLPLAPDCEITIEGRIIHFDPEKIAACLEAGANRISVGVQSFNTEVRRRQGRRASREEAIAFLEGIRARDRAALVIDLIFGLPGQTPQVWQADLETAAALEPDGIDLYGLNLIPGTPLFRAAAGGKFPGSPTLSDLGRLYKAGVDFFDRKGWRQISNSHFGRTTRERNLYNLYVKGGADCLAYGSGAGGALGDVSYSLAGELERYAERIEEGLKPIDGMRRGNAMQPTRDLVIGSFEIGRIDLSRFDIPGGIDPRVLFGPLIEQWQQAGLVTVAGDIITLTVAGRFWYGNLVTGFNDALSSLMPVAAQPPPALGAS
ncbi:MAG TPA: heme anaerobic degradation radical SAM methyltransferase ChuW/HutW [Gammaproteobacteria bacterium]|nr:heme anaerobic degradation radical SAM methyltransferase ChuW/HutW [Gammaproteobacteria bacterium]